MASTSRASSDETVAAIGGRTIHAYHVEGIGGGHAPDILAIAGVGNVIGSSTTPTIPYGRNVGGRAPRDDVVGARHEPARAQRPPDGRRPHPRQDDAGRERAARARRHQHHQLGLAGHGPHRRVRPPHLAARPPDEASGRRRRSPPHDNARILKYLAKHTINPARAHGLDRWVGSLEPGQDRRHRAVAPGVLRRQARAGDQGRLRGVGSPRRGQRLDPRQRARSSTARTGAPAASPPPAWRRTSCRPPRPTATSAARCVRAGAPSPSPAPARCTKRDMLYNGPTPTSRSTPARSRSASTAPPCLPCPTRMCRSTAGISSCRVRRGYRGRST